MARNEAMCPYCGEMINERATVCRYCGRTIRCGCDVHEGGEDGWRPARREDRHTRPSTGRSARPSTGQSARPTTGQSARPSARPIAGQGKGKSPGCLIVVIMILLCFIVAVSALLFGFVRSRSGDLEEIWSVLTEGGDFDGFGIFDDSDAPDDPVISLSDMEAPVASIAERYVDALTSDDRNAMAELFLPEIRSLYDGETEEMLAVLDSGFDRYGEQVDRIIPLGQEELSSEDFADSAEALDVTLDRVVDARLELLFENGEDQYIDLIVVETDGSWYLYGAF